MWLENFKTILFYLNKKDDFFLHYNAVKHLREKNSLHYNAKKILFK